MKARALLVGCLFLGMGFAGCLRGGDPDTATTNTTAGDDFNKANPLGGQDLVAFDETNKTEAGVGGVDHHHDMWGGASRLVLFEQIASMDPGPDDQGQTSTVFRPAQPGLVYEGTATIEFTISSPQRRACEPLFTLGGDFVCTDNAVPGAPRPDDPSPPAGLKLRYKHASTTTWIDVGELAWGTPTVLKITDPLQTDMPHATSSLWEFMVVSPNSYDNTLSFTAKAELVRGDGAIPLWPGHPDFYADKPNREVLNIPDAIACDGSAGCALAGDGENVGFLHAQKLVSYGTKTLHVWVNITESQTPNPATAPVNWFLFHLNATQRDNLTSPFDDNHTIDVKDHYWILPVDDNGMDSPYADGSRWTFQVGAAIKVPPENPVRDGVSCYGGCADWYAKYSLVVHATNEQLPFDAYHYSCLRDEDCPRPSA